MNQRFRFLLPLLAAVGIATLLSSCDPALYNDYYGSSYATTTTAGYGYASNCVSTGYPYSSYTYYRPSYYVNHRHHNNHHRYHHRRHHRDHNSHHRTHRNSDRRNHHAHHRDRRPDRDRMDPPGNPDRRPDARPPRRPRSTPNTSPNRSRNRPDHRLVSTRDRKQPPNRSNNTKVARNRNR